MLMYFAALASGMMVAASTSLIIEGANFKEVSGIRAQCLHKRRCP
jgi:hypothetical protein